MLAGLGRPARHRPRRRHLAPAAQPRRRDREERVATGHRPDHQVLARHRAHRRDRAGEEDRAPTTGTCCSASSTSKDMSPDVGAAALAAMDALNDARLDDAVDRALKDGKGALRSKAIELLSRRPDAVAQLEKHPRRRQHRRSAGGADHARHDREPGVGCDPRRTGWTSCSPERSRAEVRARPARSGGRVEVGGDQEQGEGVRRAAAEERRARGVPRGPGRRRRALGRKIFFERADVSCLRCHKIAGEGGVAGPDLSGVAAHERPRLPARIDPRPQPRHRPRLRGGHREGQGRHELHRRRQGRRRRRRSSSTPATGRSCTSTRSKSTRARRV